MKNCFLVFTVLVFLSCNNNNKEKDKITAATPAIPVSNDTAAKASPIADAATILAKRQVPVLCFHHISDKPMGEYGLSPALFAADLQAMADSGYQTILPDQLYNYLAKGAPIPEKSFMLTYDDTDEEQFSIAGPEMAKHHFKGVYFIMTISIGRPRYMSKEQIKQLADDGNVIAAHTWDHHMVTKLQGDDWRKQLVEPQEKLKAITGKDVEYFAYPFGIWSPAVIPEIKKANYKMAFILSTKRDTTEPLFTIRRMIVPGTWSTNGMMKAMKSTFHL